ncbi:MAG: hypothetical protein RI884_2166 [Pseudomonadota bacterium]|jgi:hypothetical protein
MDTKHVTLSGLYQRLNPGQTPEFDSRELRASSETGPLRVKASKGHWLSSEKSRATHIRYAQAQVRAALGESIRQKLDVGASVDISSRLQALWDKSFQDSTRITLRDVLRLDLAVQQLDKQSTAPEAAQFVTQAKPSPLEADRVHAHSPQRFDLSALRLSPYEQPEVIEDVPVHFHPSEPSAPAAPFVRPSQSVADDCFTRLCANFPSDKLETSMTRSEIGHFNGRLADLVGVARQHAPQLLAPQSKGFSLLVNAAERMKLDPKLPADTALVMVSVGSLNTTLFKALTPQGKAYLESRGR